MKALLCRKQVTSGAPIEPAPLMTALLPDDVIKLPIRARKRRRARCLSSTERRTPCLLKKVLRASCTERSACQPKEVGRSHGQCGLVKGLMSKHPTFLPSLFTPFFPSSLHRFHFSDFSVLPSFLHYCLPPFQTLTCKRAGDGAVWVHSRCNLGAGQLYCRCFLAAVLCVF